MTRWVWQPGDIVWSGEGARYSPDQPREPDGKFGSGSGTEGLISPVAMGGQVPAESKGGRGAILTNDSTHVANLTPAFAAKAQAKLESRFPGMTSEKMRENIQEQLDRGLADPDNHGATWYPAAHDAAQGISDRYGCSLEQATGAIAAMSPQQEWGSNLAEAEYAARLISEDPVVDWRTLGDADPNAEAYYAEAAGQLAGRGVDIGAWDGSQHLSDLSPMEAGAYIKASGKAEGLSYPDDVTGVEKGVTYSSGLAGLESGVEILRGSTPDDVLNGHKVRSFYDNILGGSDSGDAVTIDTHALSAAVGQKVPAQSDEADVMQTPTSTPDSAKGSYALIADAYREVAAGTDPPLSPEQVQAIVWLNWRKENP